MNFSNSSRMPERHPLDSHSGPIKDSKYEEKFSAPHFARFTWLAPGLIRYVSAKTLTLYNEIIMKIINKFAINTNTEFNACM